MTDNRAVHIIRLLQELLGVFNGILEALIAIKSDTAAILVKVNQIAGDTSAAVAALNNIITLINASNSNLANISSILNTISSDLQDVKDNLDDLLLQGTDTYTSLLALIDKVEELKVSQETFFATILKYEDNVAASGDAGIQALAVRRDNLFVSTSESGDYQSLSTDGFGRLHIVNDGAPCLQGVTLADTPSAGVTTEYYGFALPGTATNTANWKIVRTVTESSGSFSVTYADGNQLYDNVWDDYLSLTYI